MIEVRRAHPDEYASMYAIEVACFEKEVRWSKKDLLAELKISDSWIAVYTENGCQCGQSWNCICNDTPIEPVIAGFLVSKARPDYGYITSIDVLSEYRGKGIGAKLMYAAEASYTKRGKARMKLEVEADNKAQTLYFKIGYRVKRVRPKWYDNGNDCLVMVKELDMLKRMDTPAARRGMREAFNATPKQLGEAALRQALKHGDDDEGC